MGKCDVLILVFTGETYWPFTLLCVSFLNIQFPNLKVRIQVKLIFLKGNFQVEKNKILKKNLRVMT